MRLKPRQIAFIDAYTDATNKETYENATGAAKKAGYSGKNASWQGSALLKNPEVTQEIEYRSNKKQQETKADLALKKDIAWKNYNEARMKNDVRGMKFWWREHGELSGHYITKTENKTELDIQESQQAEISRQVRLALANG